MTDINKPTNFGIKIATLLGNGAPEAAGAYQAAPQAVNQVIAATEQQVADNKNPQISIDGQFIKNFIWTALKPPMQIQQPNGGLTPPKMKPQAAANPLETA